MIQNRITICGSVHPVVRNDGGSAHPEDAFPVSWERTTDDHRNGFEHEHARR